MSLGECSEQSQYLASTPISLHCPTSHKQTPILSQYHWDLFVQRLAYVLSKFIQIRKFHAIRGLLRTLQTKSSVEVSHPECWFGIWEDAILLLLSLSHHLPY